MPQVTGVWANKSGQSLRRLYPTASSSSVPPTTSTPSESRLYTAPGLEQYRPEAVLAHSREGEAVPALCYNLREAPGPDEANAEYAARLRAVLEKLGFPSDYIASVS